MSSAALEGRALKDVLHRVPVQANPQGVASMFT